MSSCGGAGIGFGTQATTSLAPPRQHNLRGPRAGCIPPNGALDALTSSVKESASLNGTKVPREGTPLVIATSPSFALE